MSSSSTVTGAGRRLPPRRSMSVIAFSSHETGTSLTGGQSRAGGATKNTPRRLSGVVGVQQSARRQLVSKNSSGPRVRYHFLKASAASPPRSDTGDSPTETLAVIGGADNHRRAESRQLASAWLTIGGATTNRSPHPGPGSASTPRRAQRSPGRGVERAVRSELGSTRAGRVQKQIHSDVGAAPMTRASWIACTQRPPAPQTPTDSPGRSTAESVGAAFGKRTASARIAA